MPCPAPPKIPRGPRDLVYTPARRRAPGRLACLSVHSSTGQTPFQIAYGYNPNSIDDLVRDAVNLPELPVNPGSAYWTEILREGIDRAHASIEEAFEDAKRRYDEKKKVVDYSKYKQAYVSSRYFEFKGVREKLKPRYLGPFDIVDCPSPNTVRLLLDGQHEGRHPVFPVSLLKPAESPRYKYPNRREVRIEEPVLIHEDGTEDWLIDRVLKEKVTQFRNGKTVRKYLVSWKGRPVTENSWVIDSDIDAPILIQEYRAREALKARDKRNAAGTPYTSTPPTKSQPENTVPTADPKLRRSNRKR